MLVRKWALPKRALDHLRNVDAPLSESVEPTRDDEPFRVACERWVEAGEPPSPLPHAERSIQSSFEVALPPRCHLSHGRRPGGTQIGRRLRVATKRLL